MELLILLTVDKLSSFDTLEIGSHINYLDYKMKIKNQVISERHVAIYKILIALMTMVGTYFIAKAIFKTSR